MSSQEDFKIPARAVRRLDMDAAAQHETVQSHVMTLRWLVAVGNWLSAESLLRFSTAS